MKRFFAGILSVCMLFSLAACGKTPDAPSTPPQEEAPALSDLPEGPLYLLTAEYGRLYAVNASGEGRLLRDACCTAFTRSGQRVLAAFDNGDVFLYDLKAGTTEHITATKYPANQLLLAEDSFFYSYATIREDHIAIYHMNSGTESEPMDYSGNTALLGNKLAYILWDNGQQTLFLRDMDSDRIEATIPLDDTVYQTLVLDGKLYLETDSSSPEDVWDLVDWEHQTIGPADVRLPLDVSEFFARGEAGFLLASRSFDSRGTALWLWKDGEAVHPEIPLPENSWVCRKDEADGKVLLQNSTYYSDNEEDPDSYLYYTIDQYLLYDTATGTVTDLPFVSDTAKLFANGDFPLLDSSTARKPVTKSLYSLFCLGTQAGGAEPLCSTTHGAWLNIADRTADIALLAEPTAEEQAYLKEKNVDVEMKLYGGDGLVFIGSDACGVTDLTLDQVRAIYRGEITNWNQLGGVDADIHVYYRDEQSGSQRLFEKLVWKNTDIPDFKTLGFEIVDEMSGIVSCCLADPYAIGYSIMTYLNDVYANESLLAFSLNGVEASPEQVAAFKYPLGTQGYVVIRTDEPENSPARRLYNWIGSPISDDLLRNNSVTPLHG